MKKRVFITGITGFIGRRLASHLASVGHNVSGSSTQAVGMEFYRRHNVSKLLLSDNIDPQLFRGCDVLIHAAYDSAPGTVALNIDGTKAISAAARLSGVRFEIYLSSISALSSASTEYARVKSELEIFFRGRQGVAIIRPGLVIGRGGLFGRMTNLIEHLPVVPLLDGGKGTIPIVACGDLLHATQTLVDTELSGEFNLISRQPPSLYELLNEFRKQTRRRTLFCPLSSKWTLFSMKLIEKTGIPMPIQVQNVEGFIANQNSNVPSHLNQLVAKELSLHDMIGQLIAKDSA